MKRKLAVQIRNEWRSNLWLAAELLIVSVVMWYVLVTVFSILWLRSESPGYDITGVWKIGYNITGQDAQNYDASRGEMDFISDDFVRLLNHLREAPGVQSVAISHNGIPYNYNRNGGSETLCRKDSSNVVFKSFFDTKYISPSYIKVMDIHGYNGETPDELITLVRDKGVVLVSANCFDFQSEIEHQDPSVIADNWMILNEDSTTTPIAVIPSFRRNDFEPSVCPTILKPELKDDSPQYLWSTFEISARVNPAQEKEFAEWINQKTGNYLTVGNVYINDLVAVDTIREINQREIREMVNNRIIIIAFLMLSIFLGLLGAFWFRTQNRTGEIAIRMVNGATTGQIFHRLIGEGLLILLAVTPIAWICDWLLVKFDLVVYLFTDSAPLWQYVLCAGITLLLIAIAVVVGIWFPARKAMRIDPASALAHE